MAFVVAGLIATFGEDDLIEVLDWRREELIATLPAFAEQVIFDPSGERIAKEDLEIWDVASGKLSPGLTYSPANASMAFSPDGTRLAVGSADERLFNAGSGAELQVLRDPGGLNSTRSCSVRTARCWLHRRTRARASGRSTSTICSRSLGTR